MAVSIILLIIALSLLISVFSGAPFLPSNTEAVNVMVQLAKAKPSVLVADIGAGNGKIVIAMARAGITAHGYEINPWLVLWGNLNIGRQGLQDKASIRLTNFWTVDFSNYDTVTIFGIDRIMGALEKKLEKELKPGSIILSNAFQFPNWAGEKKGMIYLYKK